MENKQNFISNNNLNLHYFASQQFMTPGPVNVGAPMPIPFNNSFPTTQPPSLITPPMAMQTPSNIPPQFYNNFKAYYNPVIYQTYMSYYPNGQQHKQGTFLIPQINNQNLSAFFSNPYTMNYNNQMKLSHQSNMSQIHSSFGPHQGGYFRKQQNYNNSFNSNEYNNNNNRYKNDFTGTKKNSKDILGVESKTLDDPAEIQKWVLSRKRNFPTERNVLEKLEKGKQRENAGMLSTLELKLRNRLKIMTQIDKKKFIRRKSFKRRKSRRVKNNRNSNDPEVGEIIADDRQKNENLDGESQLPDGGMKEPITDGAREQSFRKEPSSNAGFRYRKNKIYENLIRSERIKEMNVILQCFRYFVTEGLV